MKESSITTTTMTMTETVDLYTSSDVARVREILLKEQDGQCAALGIQIRPNRTPVLDHKHDDEQLVRAVLEREVNAFTGVAETAYKRFLSYWLDLPLHEVLRRIADFLERSETAPETRWRHTGWMAKLKTKFNKLTAQQMDFVLLSLGSTKGKNLAERKKLFAKQVLRRDLGYTKILEAINQQRK